ncbi:sensor histidine kinase [Nonomuraea glycinis]|uniref:sensor histidine kinase n=1 Tax=Nonomuraea glycinis TaxID=2047744 RepID=UPI0033A156C8
MSLRLRLALLFTLGFAVVIAIAGTLFLAQLRSSLNSGLDQTLQARTGAVIARLAAAQPTAPSDQGTDQEGDHHGEFSESDEVSQVLTVDGTVLESTGVSGAAPLLTSAQVRRAAEDSLTFTTTIAGERVRLLATPAESGEREVIAVVGASTDIVDAAGNRARTAIWAAGTPAVAAAGLGAWFLAGAALRPVTRMRRRLAEITEHDTAARLRVPGTRDEIAGLAATMNVLLDRLQNALARQRGFVADAGHELRTPLTALKAELELAARPGRSRRMLEDAVRAAAADTDRLIRLAEDLLLLARSDEGADFLRPEPIVVADLVEAAARGVGAVAAARGVVVAVDADRRLAVVGDPDRLRQAIGNLLDNALRHAPHGSVVDVIVRRESRTEGWVAVIEVRDRGPGFAQAFLPHAFERFRRADSGRARTQGGAGLGLAVVVSIAGAHGGCAGAANHPGGGARVWIELPARPAAAHPSGSPDALGRA